MRGQGLGHAHRVLDIADDAFELDLRVLLLGRTLNRDPPGDWSRKGTPLVSGSRWPNEVWFGFS